jgi:hypothetical protein
MLCTLVSKGRKISAYIMYERFLHTLCIVYPSLAPNADNNAIWIPNREGDIEREDNKDGAHVRGGSVADSWPPLVFTWPHMNMIMSCNYSWPHLDIFRHCMVDM